MYLSRASLDDKRIPKSALDSKRMMILGYRAVHDESETKDDKKYSKNNSHEARNRRAKNVMKLLGEHDDLRKKLNSILIEK